MTVRRRPRRAALAALIGAAIPLALVQPVGATAGAMHEYAIAGRPIAQGIATGADGALWFTDFYTPYVQRITTVGKTHTYAFAVSPNIATEIAAGSDGALWVTLLDEIHGHGRIGRITTAGATSTFVVPGTSYIDDITAGPDGALWFTDNLGKVDRITTAGAVTEFAVGGEPYLITTGPDGNLWFTDHSSYRIGRIGTAGHVRYFSLPATTNFPDAIGAGPDGALWLTVDGQNAAIYRATTAGTFTKYALPHPADYTYSSGIVSAPDGNLWFTVLDYTTNHSFIGRITTAGAVTEFPTPVATSAPDGITVGPDRAVWFAASAGYIGRVALR
jgi:streptogramin lyase